MSQWRCKIDGAEVGPVSFQELAGIVREGKASEHVLVRREGAANWEPAWHVPGLLRAAGIVEAGDSPLAQPVLSDPSQGAGSLPTLPGYVPAATRAPLFTLVDVVGAGIAAAVGLLTVGFFYHWANQTLTAFPLPPQEVEGEIVDCYFPVVGRCTKLECGLLYLDVFALAAAAAWNSARSRLVGSLSR
jgi:hypothetical protein